LRHLQQPQLALHSASERTGFVAEQLSL